MAEKSLREFSGSETEVVFKRKKGKMRIFPWRKENPRENEDVLEKDHLWLWGVGPYLKTCLGFKTTLL